MDCEESKGFLSDEDIKEILDKDIVICNYSDVNLTDIGYNLKPTEFIFSVSKGVFNLWEKIIVLRSLKMI